MDNNRLPVLKSITPAYLTGANRLTASQDSLPNVKDYSIQELDAMVASLAQSTGADRNAWYAATVEPILQIIPYVEVYDRFFMPVQYELGADNKLPVEDGVLGISYSTNPQGGIFYTKPGYQFVRPTWQNFAGGVRISWNTVGKAGWNVLGRNMNYLAWDLARKRDAAAKTVIDAAIPVSHLLTVTGSLSKASVDEVIRKSNQIGFPVKYAVINPGRMMDMQSWVWGSTGFFTPPGVAQQLIDDLFYSNYGGIKWYANPNVPATVVYFGGDPNQIGWHQIEGTPRNDSQIDIDDGVDKYAMRDANHAWYVQSGLTLWQISVS